MSDFEWKEVSAEENSNLLNNSIRFLAGEKFSTDLKVLLKDALRDGLSNEDISFFLREWLNHFSKGESHE